MIAPPRELIGVPYQDHGRGPAFDCWGLCLAFYEKVFGKQLPDYTNYSSAEDKRAVSAVIAEHAPNWEEVNPDHIREGDILVFRIGGVPFHTGVYLGLNEFIHCHRHTRSCVERLNSVVWRSRLQAVYRWKN